MKKPIVRIISLFIAVLLMLGMFSGALAMFAHAAVTVSNVSADISKDVTIGKITRGLAVTVNFSATGDEIEAKDYFLSNNDFEIVSPSFEYDSDLKLSISKTGQNYKAVITYMTYTGDISGNLRITIKNQPNAGENIVLNTSIPSDRFTYPSPDDPTTAKIITADTTVSRTLTTGKVSTGLTVTFNFIDPGSGYYFDGTTYDASEITMPLDSSFGWSYNTKLTIEEKTRASATYYQAKLTNVSYNGGSSKTLQLTITDEDFTMSVPIPDKYFQTGSGTDDGVPVSDIVVQNTIVRDAAGNKLGTVDKKSGKFTVEVLFYDIGLKDEENTAIDAAKKHAFITTPTGFKLHNGSAGTVERVASSAEYPRFKATFEGVESTGTSNTLNFRVQYDFSAYEKSIKGEAVATLFQISAESSEEDDEIAPLKPNIIVQEYSYGTDAIVAGNEFNLDVVIANTSKAVNVENVVMTIEPGTGFLITAASNTTYFPNMNAGESKPYSVALRALPSQNTTGNNTVPTDYSVTVKFSYQYLSKKEYATGETSVKIAIPVEQLDRFSVDEITDYTSYMSVGYEGYLTVPITNKGKSATMNISGTVVSDSGAEFTAPPVHYGNLEAGNSGTLNVNITVNTPGEFVGEVVISYEDDNMNQKELRVPFTIMVEQPAPPPSDMAPPPDIGQEQGGTSPFSIAMFVIGGIMLAAPVAMILMKRIKSRGNEDIDEDF